VRVGAVHSGAETATPVRAAGGRGQQATCAPHQEHLLRGAGDDGCHSAGAAEVAAAGVHADWECAREWSVSTYPGPGWAATLSGLHSALPPGPAEAGPGVWRLLSADE
jgi:hypothetical protein